MTTPQTLDTVGLFESFAYARGYSTANPALNPAAGQGSTIAVPGSRFYRFLAVAATLITSSAVVTRTPRVQLLDQDGNVLVGMPSSGTAAASATTTLQGLLGNTSGYAGGDGTLVIPMPRIFAKPGWQMQLTATNLQAGDTLTNVRWLWDEFPLGGFGYPEQLLATDPPKPL